MNEAERFFYTRDYETEEGPEIFYGDPDNHYQAIESLDRAKQLAGALAERGYDARYGVSYAVGRSEDA